MKTTMITAQELAVVAAPFLVRELENHALNYEQKTQKSLEAAFALIEAAEKFLDAE